MIRSFGSALLLLLCFSCASTPQETEEKVQLISGETMGTYYRISYVGDVLESLQSGIDSLLEAVNREVSTYDPHSTISRFNQSSKGIELGDAPHFRANFETAGKVFEQTQGAFDPTIMPLVNFWGFGFTEDRQGSQIDTAEVLNILQLVNFQHVSLSRDSIVKDKPDVQLDFSACAKGYAIDLVAEYLDRKGLNRHLVDIGGESRGRGAKPDGSIWRVGINLPEEDARVHDIITAFPVEDRSVATSGNYRNWYEVDGVKYSHIINPVTGFPERTELLSATVFHRDCILADAYATASMVLGVEKALSLAESNADLEIYLIFSRPDGNMETRYSSGLKALFNE